MGQLKQDAIKKESTILLQKAKELGRKAYKEGKQCRFEKDENLRELYLQNKIKGDRDYSFTLKHILREQWEIGWCNESQKNAKQ